MEQERLHMYVEGTDLTGKDTVWKSISEKMGIHQLQKLVIVPDNPYHLQLENLPEGSFLISPCVARAIIYDIHNADFSKDFFQISFHAMRAVSFERAGKMPLADIFDELIKYCPVFDYSLLLTASLDTKKERLARRPGKSSWLDQKINTDPDFIIRMDNFMLQYASDFYKAKVIDTSHFTIAEVLEETGSLLDEMSYCSPIVGGLRAENAAKLEQFLKVENEVKKEIVLFERTILKKD